MSQAESLFSPEAYQATVLRMRDGKFKAHLLDFADSIENKLKQTIFETLVDNGIISFDRKTFQVKYLTPEFQQKDYERILENIVNDVTDSDTFKNIMTLVVNKDLGVENMKYAQELITDIEKIIKESLKTHMQEFVPNFRFDEVISDTVWEKFKADKAKPEAEREGINSVPESVINTIVERLATVKTGLVSLSPRELAIYRAFPGTIDVKVAEYKASQNKDPQDGSEDPTGGVPSADPKPDADGGQDPTADLPIANTEIDKLYDKLAIIETAIRMGETTFEGRDIAEVRSEVLQEIARLTKEESGDLGEKVDDQILELRIMAIEDLNSPVDANGNVAAHVQTDLIKDLDNPNQHVTWFSKQDAANEINDGKYDEQLGAIKIAPDDDGDAGTQDGNTDPVSDPTGGVKPKDPDDGGSPKPADPNPDGGKVKFDVKDATGKVVKSFDTQEEADFYQKVWDEDQNNIKFSKELLKQKAKESGSKVKITEKLVDAFYEKVNEALQQYSKENKIPNNFQLFYSLNKESKKDIDAIINDFLKITPDKSDGSDGQTTPVSTTTKSGQTTTSTTQDTGSVVFQKELQDLHEALKDLSTSTTTTQSGQYGIMFPEGTTDFTKFVDKSAEQIAIDQLGQIKFSCKK